MSYQFSPAKGQPWQLPPIPTDEHGFFQTPGRPIKVDLIEDEFRAYLATMEPDIPFSFGQNPYQCPLARFLACKTDFGYWSVDRTGYFYEGSEFQGKGNAFAHGLTDAPSGLPEWALKFFLATCDKGELTPTDCLAAL